MAGSPFTVRLEGIRQLVREIAKVDPALRVELGKRNREIGERIIARAYPKPESVGEGRGAKPRPSASTNELRILAGGKHRAHNVQQWGARPVARESKRPYLIRSAEQQLPDFEQEYLDALAVVARKAGMTFYKR